jgi:hypothetical protein
MACTNIRLKFEKWSFFLFFWEHFKRGKIQYQTSDNLPHEQKFRFSDEENGCKNTIIISHSNDESVRFLCRTN